MDTMDALDLLENAPINKPLEDGDYEGRVAGTREFNTKSKKDDQPLKYLIIDYEVLKGPKQGGKYDCEGQIETRWMLFPEVRWFDTDEELKKDVSRWKTEVADHGLDPERIRGPFAQWIGDLVGLSIRFKKKTSPGKNGKNNVYYTVRPSTLDSGVSNSPNNPPF